MNTSNQPTSLKLRSRMVTSHQIPVTTLDAIEFHSQLKTTIEKAPALFQNAPSILDLSEITEEISESALRTILEICRYEKLVPFALTGDKTRHKPLSSLISVAWFDHKSGTATAVKKEPSAAITKTKVITTPVRSGQQIYARDAHLLIMNQVSAGAEVAADGNIHIFGTLRGRAIAGAQGLTSAEIICQQMQAELVAIAGVYLVQENFPEGTGAARCKLEDNHITVEYF